MIRNRVERIDRFLGDHISSWTGSLPRLHARNPCQLKARAPLGPYITNVRGAYVFDGFQQRRAGLGQAARCSPGLRGVEQQPRPAVLSRGASRNARVSRLAAVGMSKRREARRPATPRYVAARTPIGTACTLRVPSVWALSCACSRW